MILPKNHSYLISCNTVYTFINLFLKMGVILPQPILRAAKVLQFWQPLVGVFIQTKYVLVQSLFARLGY